MQCRCKLRGILGALVALAAPALPAACATEPTEAEVTIAVEPAHLRIDGTQQNGSGTISWAAGLAKALVVPGIQGSQHIWVRVRAHGVAPGAAELRVTPLVDHTGGRVEPGTSSRTCVLLEEDGWLTCNPLPVSLGRPCEVRGEVLRLEVELRRKTGPVATGAMRVVPVWYGECG